MSDTLEEQLHAAFATRLVSVSPSVVARVCATDYRPKRHRLPGLPALGGGVSVAAAGVVAAVLLLSSGTNTAFAGWTSQPTRPTAAAVRQARAVCGAVPADDLLASEARGPYVAIVYTRNPSPWECVTHGTDVFLNRTTQDPPSAFANPGVGKVTLPVISARTAHGAALKQLNAIQKRQLQLFRNQALKRDDPQKVTRIGRSLQKQSFAAITGPDSLTAVSGAVGTGVRGVMLVLADGKRVVATVKDDWYLAWWPGVDTHNAYPVSIRVTTATSTTTAGYSRADLRALFGLCLLNERCTGFTRNRIKLVSGVASVLSRDFSLFRSLPAASARTLRDLRPVLWTGAMGADIHQLRAVSFGRLGTVLAIPGTGGACVEIATTEPNGRGRSATGGGGTCNPSLQGLGRGVFMSGYSANLRRPKSGGTYSITGLVPDGNHTITVRLASGQVVTAPVKHNIVFAHFKNQPRSVTYKSAAGHTISFQTGFGALPRRRQPARAKHPPAVTK
jgi:hypothetical protein